MRLAILVGLGTITLLALCDLIVWEDRLRPEFESACRAARAMGQGLDPYDLEAIRSVDLAGMGMGPALPYWQSPFLASGVALGLHRWEPLELQHLFTGLSILGLAGSLLVLVLIGQRPDRRGLPIGEGTRSDLLVDLLVVCLALRILPFWNSLYNGQVDILVLGALTLALAAWSRDRQELAGSALALAALLKLSAGVVLVFALGRRSGRTLRGFAVTLGALVVGSASVTGWFPWIRYLESVPGLLPGQGIHGLAPPGSVANASLAGLLARLTGTSDPDLLVGLGGPVVFFLACLAWRAARWARGPVARTRAAALACPLVILMLPVAYPNHSVYLLPTFVVLARAALEARSPVRLLVVIVLTVVSGTDFPPMHTRLGWAGGLLTPLNVVGPLALMVLGLAQALAFDRDGSPAGPHDGPPRRFALPWGSPTDLLAGLAALVGCVHVLLFVLAAAARMTADVPFDWTEEQSMLHAMTLVRGWPPYHAPDVEALPPLYTPGFSFLLTPFALLRLDAFWVPRLVVTLMTLGCCVVLMRMVRRQGGAITDGLVGMGLFLGSYLATDRVFDMGRVDVPALFWLALAMDQLLRVDPTDRRLTLGSVCLVLSIYTKQSYGLPAAGLILGVILRNPRSGFRVLLTVLGLSILALLALELWSGGWFTRWTLAMPSRHPWDPAKSPWALWRDVTTGIPVWFALLTPLMLIPGVLGQRRSLPAGVGLPVLAVSMYAAAFVGRMKIGGHVNVWAGHFYLASVVGAVALADLGRWSREGSGSGLMAGAARTTLLTVALLGSIARVHDPRQGRPTAQAEERIEALRSEVKETTGPVLGPIFPVVIEAAGGGPQFSLGFLWDIGYARLDIPLARLRDRLRDHHWAKVILPREYAASLPDLERFYRPVRRLEAPGMVAGNRIPPLWVWEPAP